MKSILILLSLLVSSPSFAKTVGFSLDVSGVREMSRSTFGRLVYQKTNEDWSIGGGLFIQLHEYGDLSLNLNIGDLAQSTNLMQTTLSYTHYFYAGRDLRWALSTGLTGGFKDVLNTRIYFAGPTVQFGLDIGDDNMTIKPFVSISGVLGEGRNQSKLAQLTFGAGLEVSIGVF